MGRDGSGVGRGGRVGVGEGAAEAGVVHYVVRQLVVRDVVSAGVGGVDVD